MKPVQSRTLILAAGCLFWVLCGEAASAAIEPALTIQNSTGTAGGNVISSILFSTGTTDVSGFVFDLVHPGALTSVSVIAGSAALAAGKVVVGNEISPGVFRIVALGLSATAIGSGPAALVTMQIDNATPPGDLFLGVGGLQLTSPSGNPVAGTAAGGIVTVLTGGAISIFGVSATNVTPAGATIAWNTDVPGDSQVEYGLTSAYGQSTVLDGTLVTSHSQPIAGLTAATVYHYRVHSNAGVSGDYSFSTGGGSPPVVSGVASSVLGASSATVTWNTDIPANSQVVYGTTIVYGLATALDPHLVLSHGQTLVGLSSAALYHFAVQSQDAIGNLSASGDATFTTNGDIVLTSSPAISGVVVSNITSLTADVRWTTDQLSNSVVTYGLTGSFFLVTPDNPALSTSHTVHLSSLLPNFTYDFWVISRNTSNLISASTPSTFSTASASPGDFPTLAIGSGTGGIGGTADINVQFSPGIQPINSMEFDLGLPYLVSGGPTLTGSAATAANMTASGTQMAAGQYRVRIGGLAATLSQMGSVATVRLIIDPGAFAGTFPITVTRTLFYDSNNNVVTPVTTAGTLVITGGAPVRVWPNPWRADRHAGYPITFGHLTIGSEIRIFTTSGYWVRTLQNSINSITWDLKNEDGNRVASGLYYYLITSPNHEKVTGELVVIH